MGHFVLIMVLRTSMFTETILFLCFLILVYTTNAYDIESIVNANVVSFDQGSDCKTEGYSIGGSPACFTIEGTTELYLCDKNTKEVLISICKNTDCTECQHPETNVYGYIDGKCQDNGWLQSECTDDLVDPNRFLPQ